MIWWALLVLVIAFLLIFMELIVPSFGMIAVSSFVCFALAVALAFMESTTAGFIFVGIVIVGVPIAIYLAVKVFRYSPLGKRMILSGPSTDLSGGGVGHREGGDLEGREGVTHTKLRPSGIATIDDKRVDVVSQSARMIDEGVPVRVVKVEGNRVVVRPVESKE